MAKGSLRWNCFLLTILVGLWSIPLVGCDSGYKRIPVSGNVTLDGKPLQGGVLLFHADSSKGNNIRASCTGPVKDGHFTLVTSGVQKNDTGSGAPMGWYKVTLITDLPGTPIINVAPKYLQPETTPVAIEIVENPQPGASDIQLDVEVAGLRPAAFRFPSDKMRRQAAGLTPSISLIDGALADRTNVPPFPPRHILTKPDRAPLTVRQSPDQREPP